MKNKLNLFRQYAGGLVKFLFTITFLLTLCVGQMWGADTYAIAGAFNSWSTTANQRSGTGAISINITSTGNKEFKIIKNGKYCGNSGTMTRDNCSGWNFTYDGGSNCTISIDKTGTYVFNITGATPTLSVTYPDATWSVAGGFNSWSTTANTFSSNKTSINLTNGTTYEFKVYRKEGNVYYGNSGTMTSGNCSNWDFSSSDGNAKITANITGTYVVELVNKTPRITVHYPVAISYNKGTSGTGTISGGTKTWGTNYTLSSSTFTRTGYTQDGWATSDGGDKACDLGGTYSTHTAQTFYPHWTENTYSLTFSHNGHGTISVGGSTISSGSTAYVNYVTTKTLVASPSTGYNFSGWTKSGSNTGSVTIGNAANASTTIKATNTGATVTAGFTAKTYTITLKKNGADCLSDGSATATYNSGSVTSATYPTYTDYRCDGYYTTADGGDLVLKTDGTLEADVDGYTDGSGNWTKDGDATLYAHWTYDVTNYTVNFGVGTSYTSLGGLTAYNNNTSASISTGASVRSGHSITFTASPNTGYEVEGWYTNAACTLGKHDAGSLTYTASVTGDMNVYVKYVEKTWSVAFAAGTGGTVTTPAATPQTVGQITGISIAATPATGYTFNTWTITSGSGSFTSAATTNSNTFKPTAASTITASFNETKSTITVTTATSSQGTLKFGSTSKSWGATASLGVATTQEITATAADGFRFVRWNLSGAAASASTLTNTTITLKADGSGSTGTATAVFEEDLSSPWIVAGGNKIVTTGTTWRTESDANNTMLKKTGHSTESVVYFTVPISTVCSGDNNGNYQFKIYNTSTSKWYGLAATGDSYYLLKAEDGTEKSLVEGNKNIELRAYLTGNYEFKLDYSTSTPKLTITWPVYNQVRISAASPSDAGNVGDYDLSDPVENVRSVKRTLKANTTYTFKIVYNSDWYGHGTGTFTRSNSTSSNSRTLITSSGNLTLTTDYAGDYTFRFNQSTKALSIDFPEAYKVTYSKGAVDGSSGNSCSAKDIDNGNASVTSNSTWVKKDHRVVMTAPTEDGGYTFDGWFDNNSSTGDAITTAKNCTITVASAETYYACYHEHKTAITINTDGHGTITTPDPNESPYSLGVATTQAINATASTGYHWNTWTTSGNAALVSSASTKSNTVKGNGTEGGTGTVTATFTANTYQVQFHRNGGAGDVVYQDFTYDAAQNLTANTYIKTGYNFAGWAESTSGAVVYADEANVSNLTATNNGTFHLYAKWTPKTTTITYNQSGTGYSSGGQSTTKTATYDAAMPTPITTPTATNGYAFMGYYDDEDGEGTQYYNADGTSARTWNKEDAAVDLYAYFKKAEITALVASPGVIAPSGTVTITPTISPTPTGTTSVCYELQYSNGTKHPSQPTFTPGVGNSVSFTAPSASATYIIQATLKTGDDCGSGTELSTRTTTFQVAGEHDVTVKYMCGDLTIKASEVLGEIRPLTWSDDITAPTITGYTFARWDAGDGVTIKDDGGEDKTTSTSSTIKIKAVYDGTLTAVYNKKNMIYFNNTLGWEDVWVYFYTSDKYWANNYGTGAWRGQYFNGSRPYYDMHRGHMTQIEGTNIWYFDYTAQGWDGWGNVAFTNMGDQTGQGASADDQAPDNDHAYFSNTTDNPIQVVRRGDHKTTLPMFVPLTGQTGTLLNNSKANYVNHGYWMNYPENTGYTLKIYSGTTYGTSDQLQSIPFEFTGDMTLPMSVNVELNAKTTYGFEIHRADGTKLGESEYTLVSGNSGDDGETVRALGESERSKITTAVAGDYTFKLNYGKVSSEYHYLIGVHYPVATGDYRILYTDDAAWSKAAHSPEYAWWHESRTIHKENGAEDIVSFYVKYDSDTKMKFQYASSINASTGAVTWTDVTSGNIDLSDITADGVYNFYLTQADGAISVSKIEPYTGKYYIRTDCAGATKWENFRTTDHEMTYSEYTETNHGYSHYYPHWVEATKNVKFCIANDYSPCITDTLVEDYGTVIANIDAGGYLQNYGANIRFMWNQSTNKIWRAYIGGSSNISDRFLVLEGDAKMFDAAGNALTGVNQDHRIQGEVDTYLGTDNQVILYDDQNFVYEREIKVQTGARAKLTAKYNGNIEYFIGGADATIELLGGTESETKNKMRIVYDFKTNRLVTAYMPEGEITEDLAIHADLMIVREHQEAGQQLIFNGGSLSEVKTVYGVMRFNRWTLNNKETDGDHDPVGDPKSAYERGLYWISFPFDVNLSDVFGFGTYGTHWIIMEYDGAARATEGYWADSEGFWKYVLDRSDKVLEAGKGYVLALDLDLMKSDNTSFWTNNIEQVELFFPSAAEVKNIEATDVTTTVDAHACTIDRTNNNGPDINKNRTRADSHWNIIGIPSYANYGTTLKDGAEGDDITWNSSPYTNDLPFLYEWSTVDNTYAVQSGTKYPFKAMHAYMVQYHGDLYWSLASATPVSPIVARRTYADKPQNVEMRIELQQNEKVVDQTFVKLSNDENVSTNFAFDEDLCKEYNANKANIYTIVENYLPVAGNTMPMSDQTAVVPVGVKIAADGEYTFAIPEGTNGVGVTLIDIETGIRTPLSALDYTVNLSAGTYNERFVLEISPVQQTPTGIENSEVSHQHSDVRKVLIDGILYIVKDGKMFDATGALVK